LSPCVSATQWFEEQLHGVAGLNGAGLPVVSSICFSDDPADGNARYPHPAGRYGFESKVFRR
jgi:hypothetical protein